MSQRGTITLPKDIRAEIDAESHFEIVRRTDGVIELRPHEAPNPDETRLQIEEWRHLERETDDDVAAGRVKRFDDVESLFVYLDADLDKLPEQAE